MGTGRRLLTVAAIAVPAAIATDMALAQSLDSLRSSLDAADDPSGTAVEPVDPTAEPADPFADPETTAGTAITAAGTGLRLRRTEVAPLRPVVRPREPARPVEPLTPSNLAPVDTEADARSAYEPLGLRTGTFLTFLTSRSAVGLSSNAGGTAGGEGAAYADSQAEVAIRSDWERHALDLTVRGGLRDYLTGDEPNSPNAGAVLDGRLDLTEVDRLGGSLRYDFQRETGSSAEAGTTAGSDIHTVSASLGYERRAGLVGLDLKGAVDRVVYSADDRDNTAVSGSARLLFDNGAVIRPFVEASTFARLRDTTVDADGFRRSSVGGEARVGAVFDHGSISGEIAVGYALERFEDDGLDDLTGLVLDGTLAWRPTQLFTVTLRGDTQFEASRLPGASGSVTRTLDALAEYALRPNLILNAGATLSHQDYVGIDRTATTVAVRGGAAWRLNRNLEVGIVATHSMEDSSVAGEDTEETTIEAAVTMRR